MKISKRNKRMIFLICFFFFFLVCHFTLILLRNHNDEVSQCLKIRQKSLLDLPFIIRHLRHFTQRSKRNWYLECYHLVSSKRYFSSLFCTLTHHRMQTGLAERSRVWIGISGIRRELKRVSPVLPHFQFHAKDP